MRVALIAILGAGCTTQADDAAGMETSACLEGRCFGELECRSNLCVSDNGDTDGGSSEGSGTSGTSATLTSGSASSTAGTTNGPTSLTTDPSTTAATSDPTSDPTSDATTDATTDATADTTGGEDDSSGTTTGLSGGEAIYDVQDGTIPEGTTVTVTDAVVTAITPSGLFVQAPAGGEHSGIVVYSDVGGPDLGAAALGDEVTFTGEVFEFNELTEIVVTLGSFEISASPGAANVPAPAVLAPSDISEAWEGVFVRIEGDTFTVGLLDPLTVTDSNGQSAQVDDFIYDAVFGLGLQPGSTLTAVQGPLNGFFDLKIAPRSASDLAQ